MGIGTTPAAFRVSVEARLKKQIGPGRVRALNRLRVLMVMERFIARLNHVLPDSAVLKGGLALEFRLEGARTTKDIDLRMLGNPDELDGHLRSIEAFRPEPEDHLEFVITPDPNHPTLIGDGVKYEGFRFKVVARLAGKPYAAFGFDVAFGDPILGEPDLLQGTTFFEKYGISPITVRTYPPSTHLAEKLHAYTLPRDRVNMRMKDLVDIPLIALALDGRTATELRAAFQQTFGFRDSHPVPNSLPFPPDEWLGPYDRLRDEEELQWATLAELHVAAAALIDPILAGMDGCWSSATGCWVTG